VKEKKETQQRGIKGEKTKIKGVGVRRISEVANKGS
jgi:hypothetical protein